MMLRWMKTVGILTVVGGGVVAAAFFGLIPGWKRPAEPTASAPPTAPHTARHPEAIAVTVTAAVPRTVERRVRTVGTLHGFEEIEISRCAPKLPRAVPASERRLETMLSAS